MKKRKMLLISTLAIGLSILPQFGHAQGTMVWSHSITNSFDTGNIFNVANFWVDYEHTNPPAGYFEPLFNQISFSTNDVGHTFIIASAADDPDFTAVVNELINGVDHYMVFFLGNSSNQVGALYGDSESQLFAGVGAGPDLIGYQIQSFGLHVDSFSIDSRAGGGTDFSGQVTLSIYGIQVPEPSSAALVLLGGGILVYLRKRKRRYSGSNQGWHNP
jgi:hypothetical protein